MLRWPSGAQTDYEGSATVFADGRFAYRRLSDERRARADRTTVQYWAGGMFGASYLYGGWQPDEPSADHTPARP